MNQTGFEAVSEVLAACIIVSQAECEPVPSRKESLFTDSVFDKSGLVHSVLRADFKKLIYSQTW